MHDRTRTLSPNPGRVTRADYATSATYALRGGTPLRARPRRGGSPCHCPQEPTVNISAEHFARVVRPAGLVPATSRARPRPSWTPRARVGALRFGQGVPLATLSEHEGRPGRRLAVSDVRCRTRSKT